MIEYSQWTYLENLVVTVMGLNLKHATAHFGSIPKPTNLIQFDAFSFAKPSVYQLQPEVFLLVFLILLRLGLGAGFRRLLLRLLLLRLFQDGPGMAASEPKGGMGKKEIKDI